MINIDTGIWIHRVYLTCKVNKLTIGATYFELSEEERRAFSLHIAAILHADAEEDEVQEPGD